jgi:DNA polymerase epsilon subunit 1
MKKVWRKKRDVKKTANASGFVKGSGRLTGMFQKQTFYLTSHTWEIIQISELPNGRPGEFKMWLLIKDSLQSVRLRIPRSFYVSMKKLDDVEGTFPSFCQ